MGQQSMVVFRSVDEDEAAAARDLLSANGIEAQLLDDSFPEVPEGAWVVSVAEADVVRAETMIASQPESGKEGDPSHALDLEAVFSAATENEALTVQSMLEGAGIATVIVGDQVLPNLPFEVRVPREQAQEARSMIETPPRLPEDAVVE